MNPKLQKTYREIDRTKEKIAELQALLPGLEDTKVQLENAEVVKAFRSVEVGPAEFTAFIAAYRESLKPGAPPFEAPASETNEMESIYRDEV